MCPHEENLTAWLLGDLPPEAQQEMTRHIEACDSCRAVREELSRVLTPLRSGLEKDRTAHLAFKTVPPPSQRGLGSWLWHTPHEGLKRAAILAVSFGAFFALLSAVYRNTQRGTSSTETVTHIEFRQTADDACSPALEPVAEARKRDTAAERLTEEAERRTETFTVKTAPVPHPAPPAQTPQMPVLRRLARTIDAEVKQASPSDMKSTVAVTEAPAKESVKREQDKAVKGLTQHPPAGLMAKPVRLAGSLAPTNALSTNAIPTNAVAPRVRSAP